MVNGDAEGKRGLIFLAEQRDKSHRWVCKWTEAGPAQFQLDLAAFLDFGLEVFL